MKDREKGVRAFLKKRVTRVAKAPRFPQVAAIIVAMASVAEELRMSTAVEAEAAVTGISITDV